MMDHTDKNNSEALISSLLDMYLTLDKTAVPEEVLPAGNVADDKIDEANTVEEDLDQPKLRIAYPETGLAPAATCVAELFSSIVDEDATDALEANQIRSLHLTRDIRKALAKSNSQLQKAYPAVKADVDRCMDLLMKIQMDRSVIEESIARSQKMLRESGKMH